MMILAIGAAFLFILSVMIVYSIIFLEMTEYKNTRQLELRLDKPRYISHPGSICMESSITTEE